MESTILTKTKSGFSLLELLIVIAIMGILISVGVVSYSSVQLKTRNSRRKSDMKAIQAAFEQYYADNNGTYPANCSEDLSDYLPGGFPSDPKATFSYTQQCQLDQYCFCATLEGESGNYAANCTAGTSHFCVRNLQ
jgi:prepilin-type N-terminal cleavage/methylation domain-containing protein